MTSDHWGVRPNAPAYTYRAKVVSVYDGDTMTVDLDLGFGVGLSRQKLRLYGIDTPEIRGGEREEGLTVRDDVRAVCPIGSDIMVQTLKDKSGKFGRWLAIIWTPHVGTSVNEWLVETGRAKSYFGGKR
jgi:micrococcal nuclease